jgi:zinc finger protein
MVEENRPQVLKGETCPSCGKKTLMLMESDMDIPYFGKAFIFGMDCENEGCGYHIADVELENNKGPVKLEFEINCEDDMKVRVVKSSSATIKLPRIMTIQPGPVSNGYITNIEGILNRVKVMLEKQRDESEEKSDRKKAKNMLKKIQDIMWGSDSIKLTIEDPNGNSAIISDKTVVSKLK